MGVVEDEGLAEDRKFKNCASRIVKLALSVSVG
jgi:hypothetical protein